MATLDLFLSIVPCASKEDATRFLAAADQDLNRALNFYLEKEKSAKLSSSSFSSSSVRSAASGNYHNNTSPRRFLQTDVDALNCKQSETWRQTQRRCKAAQVKFTDPEFPPSPESIDGRTVSRNFGSSKIRCNCKNTNAALKRVNKDGPNQGKLFYSCSSRKCKFFMWANTAVQHTAQALSLQWKRLDGQDWVPVSKKGFMPSDVLQGAVGDCWFLSGLAVIAERKDLIERIFPVAHKNLEGIYEINLFFDGQYRSYLVDNCFPVTSQGKLAFAKASLDGSCNQIWVPLVEKAYAKAHKSYEAISGGWVSEAMFDLTGLPTEVVELESTDFDSEVAWARLLSFSNSKFPIACATSFDRTLKDVGLVGCHAYSILEVVELSGAKEGKQLQIDAFFGGSQSKKQKVGERESESESSSHHTSVLRLLRIRNPWGKREWKGDWSAKSDKWTDATIRRLGISRVNDGTFWMSWSDFLCRFSIIEICKAHRDWHAISSRLQLQSIFSSTSEDSNTYFELQVTESTWMYLMLLQKTKRGCTDSYWYIDINMILFRQLDSGYIVEKICFGGQNKNIFTEFVLPKGKYTIALYTFNNSGGNDCTAKVFSAKPVTMRAASYRQESYPCLLHDGLLHEGEGKDVKRIVHRLDEDLVLMRIHAQNTAVIFLVFNTNEKKVAIELMMETEATNVKIESESSSICSTVSIVNPFSQKIVCILRPKKVGIFNFRYAYKKCRDPAVGAVSATGVFSCVPLRVNAQNFRGKKSTCTGDGFGEGKAVFTSKTYGSAQ